jgi:orotidine-5'-phosphate decarboxylase
MFVSFKASLESSARQSRSRLILALDLPYRDQVDTLFGTAEEILKETADYLCGVKMNFHLITPLSLSELRSINNLISSYEMPSIADVKLNDIDNTNKIAARYLWSAGFAAIIVNPFVGYEGGLDLLLKESKEKGKGVISLAYMSHKGADEGYGLVLKNGKTMYELFLDRAKDWQVDGVIVGSTRPELITNARLRLGSEINILSPGSGAQGGDPKRSLEAGSDFLIVGRSIVESANPKVEAKRLFDSLLSWSDTHQLP